MKKENSYGIVPLCLQQGTWHVLLIQHHAGHWSFPKGHADPGESFQQTAERELKEETGLDVERYLSSEALAENYIFTFRGQRISKTVHYFPAVVTGQVVIQEREIQASQWFTLSEAASHITFKEGKRICQETSELLKKLDKEDHS